MFIESSSALPQISWSTSHLSCEWVILLRLLFDACLFKSRQGIRCIRDVYNSEAVPATVSVCLS